MNSMSPTVGCTASKSKVKQTKMGLVQYGGSLKMAVFLGLPLQTQAIKATLEERHTHIYLFDTNVSRLHASNSEKDADV